MSDPGRRLQWRWYRAPGAAAGVSVAKEEFDALPLHGRAALSRAIARYKCGQAVVGTEVKKLKGTDGLYEIKVQVGNDPFRAIFFEDSPVHCICVVACYKNQRKTPSAVLKLAKRRRRVWLDEGERRRRGGA